MGQSITGQRGKGKSRAACVPRAFRSHITHEPNLRAKVIPVFREDGMLSLGSVKGQMVTEPGRSRMEIFLSPMGFKIAE